MALKYITKNILIMLLAVTLALSASPAVSYAKIYIGDEGKAFRSGDINGDGSVDTNDVKYLLMYIHFPDVYGLSEDERYADFNADDKVDDADAVYLLMHIKFPTYYKISSEN